MLGEIQEGISWDQGSIPRNAYKLLILRSAKELRTEELRVTLHQLWLIAESLKEGIVPSLGEQYPVDSKDLHVLIGYGHKFFERDDLAKPSPEGMIQSNRFPQPDSVTGRAVLPGAGIVYDDDVKVNPADEEIAIQITANSALAVHRVHVEFMKYLESVTSQENPGISALTILAVYDGFSREDRRSWIDFHDGISNLRKGEERRQVIAIKPDNAGGQEWTLNGTYMVFMRLPVNLATWEKISQKEQEILVGRTKQSGCPLIGVASDGTPSPDPRCPVTGTKEIVDAGNEMFREPSSVVSDAIKVSHVQRANHHRSPVFKPDSRRIYRQGFEFLDETMEGLQAKAGLNFVSFQDDPDRVMFILTQSDWLGNLSFGGDPARQSDGLDRLITTRAAGTFFVPPVFPNSIFPGVELFS